MEGFNPEVLKNFRIDLDLTKTIVVEQIISGHINLTYSVAGATADGQPSQYIFQRINHNIFKDPCALMDNICLVTEHIRNADPDGGSRSSLTVIMTNEGKNVWISGDGYYWRCYVYLYNSMNLDGAGVGQETFVKAGRALCDFQKSLMDFDASKLTEVLPNFHNTVKRYENFLLAVENNTSGRLTNALPEVEYAMSLKPITGTITERLADGRLPLRVTHNDTKLSNIMIDKDTREVLCFIDLDTVMPGSALYDFGDALRAGGSSALEDEEDLTKVYFREDNFDSFLKGFMGGADYLTAEEISLLPESVILMTYECGIRFLSDYLDGDVYFSVHKPDHNLIRARNQLHLVKDMLSKVDRLHEIVAQNTPEFGRGN
ncbi:MAG: aminoglycoside phosphotransferase family protein [Clostridia bacterium]|nr:aminoglycoside phosphotransferase family protein [Clostridia bacterium]